jgi:hypothetical protein
VTGAVVALVSAEPPLLAGADEPAADEPAADDESDWVLATVVVVVSAVLGVDVDVALTAVGAAAALILCSTFV